MALLNHLTNRWSQPLAAMKPRFDFMKQFRMFAALVMVSMSGIVIFLILSFISHLLLRRWHESAVTREN